IATAKGLTGGALPMGAVIVDNRVHEAFMQGPEEVIELFHGYTCSGHPVASAAALAALDIYASESLFDKAATLGPYWEDAAHSLHDLPHVIDVRNYGLLAGIELAPRPGQPGRRAYEVFADCFHNRDLLIRVTGDVIALSPPLILDTSHIERIFDTLHDAITNVA
ncbi:MAG: aminotransferase class III-fold pyridoxal phosphate-dependent enzyme, partial [Gammaproteobacteria bacterium]